MGRANVPAVQSSLHAIHDERHPVFECPAMPYVRDLYPASVSPARNAMLLYMWQHNAVQIPWGTPPVAYYIMGCSIVLGAVSAGLLMMRHPHHHQPWRLDGRLYSCKPGRSLASALYHDHLPVPHYAYVAGGLRGHSNYCSHRPPLNVVLSMHVLHRLAR